MRICCVPHDTSGVGSYRCLFPMRELNRLDGFDCVTPDFTIRKGSGSLKQLFNFGMTVSADGVDPDADVYVFQRYMWEGAADLFRDLRAMGRKVVCETDDLYPVPVYNGDHEASSPAGNPGRNWLHMHKGFRRADQMTVSTEFLADYYSGYCPDITVIPNYLDWEMWRDVPVQNEVDRGGRVRVGWAGAAWIRPDDLAVLRGLIPRFLERNPHVDFVCVGDPERGDPGGAADLLGVPADRRVVLPRCEFRDLRSVMHMDVGLVPLASNRFNEAKSALKGMEYNANGIPFVASPTAEYRKWTVEGENGFLARRPADWLRHMELLVNDHDLRREMGWRARVMAERASIQNHVGEWVAFYERLVPEPAASTRGGRRDLVDRSAAFAHRDVAHRPVLLSSVGEVEKDPVVAALRQSQVATRHELRAVGR